VKTEWEGPVSKMIHKPGDLPESNKTNLRGKGLVTGLPENRPLLRGRFFYFDVTLFMPVNAFGLQPLLAFNVVT
jgi:hypothetical protein